MIDRFHQDRLSDAADRKIALDAYFIAGRIGEPTYRLSLEILRFTRTEIDEAVCQFGPSKTRRSSFEGGGRRGSSFSSLNSFGSPSASTRSALIVSIASAKSQLPTNEATPSKTSPSDGSVTSQQS